VINSDDAFGQALIDTLPHKKNMIAYGMQPSAVVDCVFAKNIKLEHGISAHVVTPWGEGELQTN